METLFVGQNKITLQTTDSTNNYAAKLLKMSYVPDGTVIMAHNQTEGRGQREKLWESAPGENLLCSFILKPNDLSAIEAFTMSMAASLAVYDTVLFFSKSTETRIKWPNDIILKNKKIGGILIENYIVKGQVKHVTVGIGLNINQTSFPFSHATSMLNETHRITDLDLVLSKLSSYLEKWYLKLQSKNNIPEISQNYNQHLWRHDEEIEALYMGKVIKGKIVGVSTEGVLHFLTETRLLKADFSLFKIPYE